MLNLTLMRRPQVQPAALLLTSASPAAESPFFAHSNDFSHSNDDVTVQPDQTGRHCAAHADVIPLSQTKTHSYSSWRSAAVSLSRAAFQPEAYHLKQRFTYFRLNI
ncbi:hypothetical protein [Dickeya undicola]|uniref:hypothetical protein n=1 Tax=Dickeya undicola TaxID=1577887 RepID=UPI0011CD8977|nr:hypothetical protein [Dickeya undicola]